MRWVVLMAFGLMACSGHYTGVSGGDGDDPDGSMGGEPSDASGGAETASGGSSDGAGGEDPSPTGGRDGSGGAIGVGGSSGGSSGGSPSGGQGSGGDGVGGSPPVEVVLWTGSYSGGSVAMPGDKNALARLYLDAYDCPTGAGSFEPGETAVVDKQILNSSCAEDGSDNVVAQFGPMEWDMPDIPDNIYWQDPNIFLRFTLESFSASPWPAVSGTEVSVSFKWEIMSIQE